MPEKKLYRIATIILLITILGLGAFFVISSDADEKDTNEELAAPDIGADKPVTVQTAVAEKKDLIVRITANGRTRALRQVVLTAQVGGVVERVAFLEGERAAKGALLVQIDDTDYQLKLREAREQLTAATIEYGKKLGERRYGSAVRSKGSEGLLLDPEAERRDFLAAKEKFEAGSIDREEFTFVQYAYEAAKIFSESSKQKLIATNSGLSKAIIAFERAKMELERTRITAPFSGVVGDVKVEAGESIGAGKECLTLVDLSRLLIDIEVLESEIDFIKLGRKARATFTAFPGETFTGKVVAINPLIDPEKKTRRTTILLDNSDEKLIPGMYAFVKLDARIYPDRLLVPKEAVVLRDQRPVVFIARKNENGELRAVWSYVETGHQNEQFVEILSSKFNLQPGEQVVISNHYTMIHDAKLKIRNK